MRWRKYALAFLATALAGLVAWVLTTPAVAGRLLGDAAYVAAYSFPLFRYFGMPLLALVAVLVGYLLPKGFFLWGIALVSLRPIVEAWQTSWADSQGAFGPSGLDGSQLAGLLFVQVTILVVTVIVCTAAAALGAGLRLLWWWIRGESVQSRLGIAP